MKWANARRTGIVSAAVAAIASCGGSDGMPTEDGDDFSDEPSTVLEASVREWGDVEIIIDYTLRNALEETIVVFNDSMAMTRGTRTLQSELVDGDVRLFTGKSDANGTAFATPPEIPGLSLEPGESLVRTGGRPLPITIDYDFDGEFGPFMPESIEFCVGHGRADEVLPTRRESGDYALNSSLELQTLDCVTLSR